LAALGYTQQRPTEDRYLMSQKELMAKIDVLLGGRVAEKIMFQDVTTGAHNDLQRATDIARAIVSEYGMGETLGLSTYPRNHGRVFWGSLPPAQHVNTVKEPPPCWTKRYDRSLISGKPGWPD
jgi:ATP-dependent Zn protease